MFGHISAVVFLCTILIPFITAQTASIVSNLTTPSLNVTTSAARDGRSIIQCWSIPSFTQSATAGTAGALNLFLGEATNATFTVIPPRFDGGLHRAPVPQFVLFTSGLAHVTLPNTTTPESSAWIYGGKYGMVLAMDTADVSELGHFTTYPSASDSVTLQVPLSQQGVQRLLRVRKVLYEGACRESELTGL